jgi:hypothetical protein
VGVGSARSRNVVTRGVALSQTGKGIHLLYGDQVSEGTLAQEESSSQPHSSLSVPLLSMIHSEA